MSYISPIKLNTIPDMEEGWTDKIAKYIAGETDKLVLESCVKVACDVDEEELLKALQYDRGQYEKGYADGKRDAAAAIEELLPKRGEWELIDEAEPMRWGCSRCKYLSWETSSYCPRCGAKMEVQE